MSEVSIVVRTPALDEPRVVTAGTTPADLFEDRTVVVARVNGRLRDLNHVLGEADVVEPVGVDSPDGLAVLRHSAAHVLAQAVQEINPKARLGIGPPIKDGFYYDFDVETPFTPEDLKAFEKVMQRIIKEGQTFRRRVVSEDEARQELAAEPYKIELIGLKGTAGRDATAGQGGPAQVGAVADGASVEVGGDELTIYDNLRRDGSTAWRDLCRGPHVPSTRLLGNGFQLMRSAAAYWRGSEKNPQLQRVYGTAWADKGALKAHLERIAEAERRDHRRLGVELDLFSFPDALGRSGASCRDGDPPTDIPRNWSSRSPATVLPPGTPTPTGPQPPPRSPPPGIPRTRHPTPTSSTSWADRRTSPRTASPSCAVSP